MRTPDGYDSETGAPVASGGGGYDPDAPTDDVPKEPRVWWSPLALAVLAIGGLVAKWCGP